MAKEIITSFLSRRLEVETKDDVFCVERTAIVTAKRTNCAPSNYEGFIDDLSTMNVGRMYYRHQPAIYRATIPRFTFAIISCFLSTLSAQDDIFMCINNM